MNLLLTVRRGEPVRLGGACAVRNGVTIALATGDAPEEARNRAVTEEELRQRLTKTGGTVFAADQIEIELDEGLMVSASAVNALRRELLDELAECVAGSESPETELLRKELTASLNRFLRKLPEKDRTVFLLRYYYAGTKEDIARKTGLSSNQVKYILQKVRKQLADTLKKEGLQ